MGLPGTTAFWGLNIGSSLSCGLVLVGFCVLDVSPRFAPCLFMDLLMIVAAFLYSICSFSICSIFSLVSLQKGESMTVRRFRPLKHLSLKKKKLCSSLAPPLDKVIGSVLLALATTSSEFSCLVSSGDATPSTRLAGSTSP